MMVVFYIFLFTLFLSSASFADECVITYGVYADYRPYEWIENDEFHGINIDLVKAIGDKAGCRIVFVSDSWPAMVEKLKKGEITLLASSINADTIEYAVPLPTMFVRYRILLGHGDSQKIASIEELAGTKLLLKKESIAYAGMKKAGVNAEFIFKSTDTELLSSFMNGEGDFVFVDDSAFNFISQFPSLKTVSDPLFPTLYGFIIKQDDPLFGRISEAMESLQASGKYYSIVNEASSNEYARLFKAAVIIIAAGFAVFLLVMLWNKSLRYNVTKKTKLLKMEIEKHVETERMLWDKSRENNDNIRLLQTILNAIPEAIFIIDANFGLLWRNNEKSSKFNLEEVRDTVLQHMRGNAETAEFSVKDNNNLLWKILILKFHYKTDGNYLLVVSDITENVRLRDEMFMTTRYSALGEMSAIIAHEINTPLGSVLHNFDYLSEFMTCDEGSEEYTDIVQSKASIENSLDKIKSIVDELKRYTNRISRDYEMIDLSECVKSAIGITRFFINKKTSRFYVDTENCGDAVVYGNYGHIEQMIINILQNACYALTNKSQSISCAMESDGEYIKITVADEGCGMTEDVIKNACNPYFSTRRENGGTGLGLSLTSRLIAEHKGFMDIKSEYGKGTLVSLYFPKGAAK